MRSYIKVTGRAKQVKSNAESGPGMVVEEAYVHFEDTDAQAALEAMQQARMISEQMKNRGLNVRTSAWLPKNVDAPRIGERPMADAN